MAFAFSYISVWEKLISTSNDSVSKIYTNFSLSDILLKIGLNEKYCEISTLLKLFSQRYFYKSSFIQQKNIEHGLCEALGCLLRIQSLWTKYLSQIIPPMTVSEGAHDTAFAHSIIVLSLDDFICQIKHILLLIYLYIITSDVKIPLYLFPF